MALLGKNLNQDNEYFKSLYDMSCEEFINRYDDNIEIDLTDKIVVAIEGLCLDKRNVPMDVIGVFINDGIKHKYNAKLIYAGHISFIKIEHENGKVEYLYKDDECIPQTVEEWIENCSDIYYEWVDEKGRTVEEIFIHIENYIKVNHDIDFKLNKEDLIILEGL